MYFHMNCDYKTIMKSQKNGHGNAQIAKIFCDLSKVTPQNAKNQKTEEL